jgi:hypothetical protein
MRVRLGAVLAVAILTMGMASPALATSRPKPPPSLAKVKRAIQSNGVTLCQIGSPPDFVDWSYGASMDGACSDEDMDGEWLIFIDSTNRAAKNDATGQKSARFSVWINQTVVVATNTPIPGTNTALSALGFKRA